LSKLGRNLSRTLIIDNVADNFKLQIDNGIHIKNFEGDENDIEFFELSEDLKNIVRFDLDVRDAIPKIREKMLIRNNDNISMTPDGFMAAPMDCNGCSPHGGLQANQINV
jgi:hypothetical protein